MNKSPHVAESSAHANAKPPTGNKRTRKRDTKSFEFIPNDPAAADVENTVQFVTVTRQTHGRFGVRRDAITVERPSQPAPPAADINISPEDVDALDASEWQDMFDDDVVCKVKVKRKQRNDSVSFSFNSFISYSN